MRRWLVGIVAAGLAALAVAAAVFVIRHDWAVEDLMERVHAGRESPWEAVRAQGARDAPEWELLRARVPIFLEMAAALEAAKHPDTRASADGYAAAARDLGEAVRGADAVRLREAIGALGASCADCHFDGGVGGVLDHD